jgi:hypothetical protein
MAALPHAPFTSVEEYLNTSFDPDMEYVDGALVGRQLGDWLHSLIQSNVLEKLREYANKGVPNIWLIDPRMQLLYTWTPPTLREVTGDALVTSDGSVELWRDEIFAQ